MSQVKIDLEEHGEGLVAHRYIKGSAPNKMPFIWNEGDFSWYLSQERPLSSEDVENSNRLVDQHQNAMVKLEEKCT